MILGGASSVWAQTETIYPSKERTDRTNNAEPTAWNSGFPKISTSSGNTQCEVKNIDARIWVLEQFVIPDIARVKSITLTYTRVSGQTNNGPFGIWAFPYSFPNDNEDFSTETGKYIDNVKTVLGAYPGNATTHDCLVATSGSEVRTATFDATAIAALKDAGTTTDGTLTVNLLLTTTSGTTNYKFYSINSSNTDENKPHMTVEYYPAMVVEDETTTYHSTLNAAFDAITSSGIITLYNDITITNRCNTDKKTITITPAKDVTVSSTITNNIWILNNQSAGDLTFGSDDHHITIDGGNYSVGYALLAAEHGTTRINNVTFKNCHGTTDNGVVHLKSQNSGATLYLKNVTFDGCTANEGRGIVTAGTNNCHLQNAITFTDCSTGSYNFYLQDKFLRVGDLSTTQVAPFTVYYQTPSLEAIILSRAGGGDVSSLFNLMNDNFGIIKDPGHYTDHKITEAYTMTMNAYGASTLVLPFDAKIPAGVTAYTLNYTAGNSSVKATEVTGGTLSANTPVLINGDASTKYWFINTSIVDATTTGSGTHTEGALTGVYATTSVPADSYILWADATHDIGFYKANSSTVAANRAYLTAEGGAGVKALSIIFGDETGIKAMDNGQWTMDNGRIYNLAGQRLNKARKGINIVNGMKYVVK